MPIVTYPVIPDSWSESLTPDEGQWLAGTADGTVTLDLINKQVGGASIRHQDGADYIAYPLFRLNSGAEFDGTKTNAKIHFYFAIDEYFDGVCRLVLIDNVGKQAWREFGTAPNSTFEAKEFSLAGPWGYVATGFDWTHIKEIGVWGYYTETGDSYCWIDSLHFSYEVSLATLNIQSSPTGKHFTIDGTSGYTPATFQLTPDATYTVTIDDENFTEWEDKSTSPTRNITLAEGETLTIIAYYEGAPPPNHEFDWRLVFGGGLLAIGIIYFLT